jgi:putative oxidoreductase
MNYPERAATFSDPLGVGPATSLALAVFAEVVCAGAVILGLMTRFAVVPIVILLLVAATIVHADDPWRNKEFALIFAIPFLALIFTGPGRYSLDHLLFGGSTPEPSASARAATRSRSRP